MYVSMRRGSTVSTGRSGVPYIENTNNDLRFHINIMSSQVSEWACGAAIWYDRLLSDTEISEIETYLVDKYYNSTEIVEE
jgi:hypothetical protein